MGGHDREPFTKIDKLLLDSERFSDLSSEMARLLTSLSQEIRASAAELQEVQDEIDFKKRELEELRGMEKSVAALESQVEDLRRQKEELDRFILEQRAIWDADNARRAREEAEYAENLKIQRERQEEEYRQRWADEQLKTQKSFEEQVAALGRKNAESQKDLEKALIEREASLKNRELEWRRLVRELDTFMIQLEKRVRHQVDTAPIASLNTSAERESLLTPEFHRASTESNPEINSDQFSVWDNV